MILGAMKILEAIKTIRKSARRKSIMNPQITFDKVIVCGQCIDDMSNLTIEQLQEIDRHLDEEYQAEKALVKRMMDRMAYRQNGNAVQASESIVPVKIV